MRRRPGWVVGEHPRVSPGGRGRSICSPQCGQFGKRGAPTFICGRHSTKLEDVVRIDAPRQPAEEHAGKQNTTDQEEHTTDMEDTSNSPAGGSTS